MLQNVPLRLRNFHEYSGIIEPELFDEVLELAGKLAGKRILQVNSTATRGGVAEILESLIPLLRDLGLAADWKVMSERPGFYDITKLIHNGLQGDTKNLTDKQWETYEDANRELAQRLEQEDYDVVMIHDPQPVAARSFMKKPSSTRWIWRYHGDSSTPNPHYRDRIMSYLEPYDAAVFTLADYVLPGYAPQHLAVTPMAIDPLSLKNMPIERDDAMAIIEHFGINMSKPLITQISRFDPWKDPLGVIEAWQKAKQDSPDLQLALIGNMANDDPQGGKILEQVRARAKGLDDIFILANVVGARGIKAFQMLSDVALQKSLREGFGLTVAEALWSGTPVVGGNVGGIKLQIEDGRSGFLVDSVEEAAKQIVWLLQNPHEARAMGEYGRAQVRKKFLLPRLVRDDLKLIVDLLADD